jgi:DNA-binding NarL/FixJ family response regulator
MQLTGSWDQALAEAGRAAERFTQGVLNQIALGLAHYRLGEIHRLRGSFDDAEMEYREASRWGFVPEPGTALMRLSQGKDDAAAATIRRAITETTEPLARARLLPAYVDIMLAIGDIDAASTAARELERIAAHRANEVLEAMSAQARGQVNLAVGDAGAALIALRRAIAIWQSLRAPYEVARLRVLVSSACAAFGDEEAARLELDTARESFAALGAQPDLSSLRERTSRASHGLTEREVEVLRLVAAGKGNREIAGELTISEHTVARHVQNIFAKLDVSSRTAATAFAFEQHLV